MSDRLDVRRMLLARGWDEKPTGMICKGDAVWAPWGSGDSALTSSGRGPRRQRWTVDFGRDVPARVIVAMAEAAAEETPRPPRRPRLARTPPTSSPTGLPAR